MTAIDKDDVEPVVQSREKLYIAFYFPKQSDPRVRRPCSYYGTLKINAIFSFFFFLFTCFLFWLSLFVHRDIERKRSIETEKFFSEKSRCSFQFILPSHSEKQDVIQA